MEKSEIYFEEDARRLSAKHGKFTQQRVVRLYNALAAGQISFRQLQDTLAEGHLELLIKAAIRRYYNHSILSRSDLRQIGALGLLRAIKKYDYRGKMDFRLYASYYIDEEIKSQISIHQKDLQFPNGYIYDQAKLEKAEAAFLKKNNFQASIEELTQKLNWPLARAKTIDNFRRSLLTIRQAANNSKVSPTENLICPNSTPNENRLYLLELIKDFLPSLSEIERLIVEISYFDPNQPKKISDLLIVDLLHNVYGFKLYCRNTIRALKKKALRKIATFLGDQGYINGLISEAEFEDGKKLSIFADALMTRENNMLLAKGLLHNEFIVKGDITQAMSFLKRIILTLSLDEYKVLLASYTNIFGKKRLTRAEICRLNIWHKKITINEIYYLKDKALKKIKQLFTDNNLEFELKNK